MPELTLEWIPFWGLLALVLYFASLLALSFYRARSATLSDYYIGSRKSTWWLITLGMISDSVSGVTFVSVPGSVFSQGYSYFQIVMGYFLGYLIIAKVLLPIYYARNLISIYTYLGERFGPFAQKTASVLFISSRTFGSAARLYISVMILHQVIFSGIGFTPGISFTVSVGLIVLYTYKGGIKSLVWTEAYQSVILLIAIGFLFAALWGSAPDPVGAISSPRLFFTDPSKPDFFLKQIFGGMLITCAMNGLDQNIMQMNLSCPKLADAQKNMVTLAFVMVAVNFVFVALGALVHHHYLTAPLAPPLTESGKIAFDQTLSKLTLGVLGKPAVMMFIIGLSAATFSSAGTILPAIASSIEIDLLPARLRNRIPVRVVHSLAALLILGLIFFIHSIGTKSLIDLVLRCSGYTYGPLIGLFGIGIFTKVGIRHRHVPLLSLASIGITAWIDFSISRWFRGYRLGVELIAINAILFVCFGLLFSRVSDSGSGASSAST
jgi:SSS family solute:Na+ symporter